MNQDWINALAGGCMIGLAATILLLVNGRVAGVSGIFFGIIRPGKGDFLWRILFVLGLVLGGGTAGAFLPTAFENSSGRPLLIVAIAGFVVGFGTFIGSGCTSGHGVCGISRMSVRSMVATMVFIATGVLTTLLYNLAGGAN
jgi:uncharacterized membrane protein YedE/YeeE